MWKHSAVGDGHKPLVVKSGTALDISSLFDHRSSTEVPARKTSSRRPTSASANAKDGLLASPPNFWTEHAVYEFLGKARKKLPHLEEVLEMHVRVCGGHKFLCKFMNANREACVVWVGDGQFARVYPDEYAKAKLRFAMMVNR